MKHNHATNHATTDHRLFAHDIEKGVPCEGNGEILRKAKGNKELPLTLGCPAAEEELAMTTIKETS